MNKKALGVVVLIVAVGAGILLYQKERQHNQLTDKVSQAETALPVRAENHVTIEISNFAFSPQIVKVKKGTTITWVNKDNAPHTVTSDSGAFLDSPRLDKDGQYQKQFNETGTYRYHCKPHPNMIAAVIVVD